jgi:DNA-binding transcriptional MerR regulator
MKENTITLAAVVDKSPVLIEGVSLEDVRYFMDIAEAEKEWVVARALKTIVEAEEARLKEEAEEEAAIEAELAQLAEEAKTRTYFCDGFNGYVTFAKGNVILLEDYVTNDEGETLRAEKKILVDSSLWNELLQMGRDGYAVGNEEAATCSILEKLTGVGAMWSFSREDYKVMTKEVMA